LKSSTEGFKQQLIRGGNQRHEPVDPVEGRIRPGGDLLGGYVEEVEFSSLMKAVQ
jgi:hypothetical protein